MRLGVITIVTSTKVLGANAFAVEAETHAGVATTIVPTTDKKGVISWKIEYTEKNVRMVESRFYLRSGFFVDWVPEFPVNPFDKKKQDKLLKDFAVRRGERQKVTDEAQSFFDRLEAALSKQKLKLDDLEQKRKDNVATSLVDMGKCPEIPKKLLEAREVHTELAGKTEKACAALKSAKGELATA